ncbi:MAG: hypothetical protein LV479_09830 [Methylacidiphilales bacterium]|nr:hypothetical protein [Candidatus Methylacidiphilales bacterium]
MTICSYYCEVIAPEAEEGIKRQTHLGILLRNNLLASALIFALLQCWRPCFFLTDDNLDGGYPFFMGMGHRLLSGRSPFISDYLFGGHYDLLRDPTFFSWHPLYLLVSLLAGTPFHFFIIDVDAFVFFMLATAGFVCLAHYLRGDMALEINDGWIMFFTLSFTYSVMALTTGASWLNFLGNHSGLPWLALGILQRTWRRGIIIVMLASLHSVLAGHLSPTVSGSILFTLFALGVSLERRSIMPIGCWLLGYGLAIIIMLPLLVPMVEGFFTSWRAHGVSLDDMQSYNIPLGQMPIAFFIGTAVWLIQPDWDIQTTYTLALGASAAAWCLLPALTGSWKWRGLELVTFGMMIFVGVLIWRPLWITRIMIHLPLFKSMRWPFRELLQFQFFFHLFLLLRPPGFTLRGRRITAFASAATMVVPMLICPLPPSFNAMNIDRELLFTGGMDRYWDQVRPMLQPGDRVAVLIPEKVYNLNRFAIPYSLLGTYNYAIVAHITNTWGYSPTAQGDQLYTRTYAYYPFGAYNPEPPYDQKERLMAERPELKFITLESLVPLRITLSSRDGPTVDLTPYVPKVKGMP